MTFVYKQYMSKIDSPKYHEKDISIPKVSNSTQYICRDYPLLPLYYRHMSMMKKSTALHLIFSIGIDTDDVVIVFYLFYLFIITHYLLLKRWECSPTVPVHTYTYVCLWFQTRFQVPCLVVVSVVF
jgi:hypothetical protein